MSNQKTKKQMRKLFSFVAACLVSIAGFAATEAVAFDAIVSGTKYAITAEATGGKVYILKPGLFAAGKSGDACTAECNPASLTEADMWTFTGSATDGWTITTDDGGVLYVTNNNNGVVCAKSKTGIWTAAEGEEEGQTYLTSSDGTNSRYLTLYAVGPNWRCYKNTDNGFPSLVLYKAVASSDPEITAPAVLDFKTVLTGSTVTDSLTITASNLTTGISYAWAEGGMFTATGSLSTTGGKLAIATAITAEGAFVDTLVLTSGATVAKVAVKASAVSTEGAGTLENPFTLADVKKLNNGLTGKQWVVGTIAGCYDTEKGGLLDSLVASNIALATGEDIIPVQLVASTSIRTALNLKDHPDYVGRELKICGDLQSYCSTTGVKAPTDYELGEAPAPEPFTLNGVWNVVEGEAVGYTITPSDETVPYYLAVLTPAQYSQWGWYSSEQQAAFHATYVAEIESQEQLIAACVTGVQTITFADYTDEGNHCVVAVQMAYDEENPDVLNFAILCEAVGAYFEVEPEPGPGPEPGPTEEVTFDIEIGAESFTITPSDPTVMYYVEVIEQGYDSATIVAYVDANLAEYGAGLEYFDGPSTQSYENDWYCDLGEDYTVFVCAVSESYERISGVTLKDFTYGDAPVGGGFDVEVGETGATVTALEPGRVYYFSLLNSSVGPIDDYASWIQTYQLDEWMADGYTISECVEETMLVEESPLAFQFSWFGITEGDFRIILAYIGGTETNYFVDGEVKVVPFHMEGGIATSIENTKLDAKAVKFIENGQLIIEKDGIRYTVLGLRK